MNKKIRILAALKSDTMEGWGWISKNLITKNGFYKISHSKGKNVLCYLRIIDNNFIDEYNSARTHKIEQENDSLIINEYYRTRLKISETNKSYHINISKCNFLCRVFKFEFTHPNPYVRQSSKMTVLSLVFGIISLGLTIFTICYNL